MKIDLLNPFGRLAGIKSLIIGVIGISLTIVVAHLNNVYFPNTFSIIVDSNVSLQHLIIQIIANWLILSIILYIAALMFSKSAVRAIDIFGTQAVARIPHLIAAISCFNEAIVKLGKYALWQNLKQGEPVMLTSGEMGIAILQTVISTLAAIWVLVLSVNSFKVSANIKGRKLATIYIVCLIISTALSAYISFILRNSL